MYCVYKHGSWATIAALVLFASSSVAVAGSGTTMSFQGKLTDDGGVPIDENTNLKFSVWTHVSDPTSTYKIWEETLTNVAVSGGLFQVTLGTTNALDDRDDNDEPVFTGEDRWLQVEVDNGSTYEALSPRIKIAAASHALSVTRNVKITVPDEATDSPVEVLGGIAANDTNGAHITIRAQDGGADGLDEGLVGGLGGSVVLQPGLPGTNSNPGAVRIDSRSFNYPKLQFFGYNGWHAGTIFGEAGTYSIYYETNSSGKHWFRTNGGTARMVLDNSGNLGIGTGMNLPGARLHVKDDVVGYVASIENESSDSEADGLKIKINETNPGSGNRFVSFIDAGGEIGHIEKGGGCVQFGGGTCDFAEYFEKVDPQETFLAGQIVYLVGNKVTGAIGGDWHSVGVVSQNPLIVGGIPYGRVTDLEARALESSVAEEYDSETLILDPAKDGWKIEERLTYRVGEIERETERRVQAMARVRTKANLAEYCCVALTGRIRVNIKGHADAGDYILADGTPCKRKNLTFEQYQTCVGKTLESGEGQVLCLVGIR